MPELLTMYELVVLAVLLALLGIVVVNLAMLPSATAYSGPWGEQPAVAVLVPARNEEANIRACLASLLGQDYPSFEVWLYDDASTDNTLAIAQDMAVADSRLRVVRGTAAPPAGWLGKAHACHRLYEDVTAASSPDYIIFTDADVRFDISALSHTIAAAQGTSAGLLSIFPRQVTVSWAERLAVPVLLHWAVYTFLPLPLAFTLRTGPAFAAANGQFMLFKREVYEACGGHMAVRSEILEDVALARVVKGAGYKATLADGGPLVRTRMYRGAAEVWEGYSKNAFAFFGYSPLFLLVGLLVLSALYLSPLLLGLYGAVVGSAILVAWGAACYGIAVLARLLLAVRFRYRLADAFLHPLAVLFLMAICLNSMRWRLTGKGVWKGRSYTPDEG